MLSSRRKLCRRYNGMRCEADRCAHIPRVGTLTHSRTHCEADRRAHIPRVGTLAAGNGGEQGLCSLTLRIPLPLAAGALATDWQPDGGHRPYLFPLALQASLRRGNKYSPPLARQAVLVAERQGFEPWEQLPVHRISSAARSTTPASLQKRPCFQAANILFIPLY